MCGWVAVTLVLLYGFGSVSASLTLAKDGVVSPHSLRRVLPSSNKLAESAPETDEEEYTGSVYAMYTGILVLFGIMWTIYFFLYAWQYDSMGNYSFFLSSYIVLVVLIALGLSKYFTGSILTALLWTVIFISISSAGFLAMSTITSPDRFEGDKSNMGRTKLE